MKRTKSKKTKEQDKKMDIDIPTQVIENPTKINPDMPVIPARRYYCVYDAKTKQLVAKLRDPLDAEDYKKAPGQFEVKVEEEEIV